MEDFNQAIFFNVVWEVLAKEPNDKIIRKFCELTNNELLNYQINGGTFPTVEFILGKARDIVTEEEKEKKEQKIKVVNSDVYQRMIDECKKTGSMINIQPLTSEERKEQVRNSWINKFSEKKMLDMDSNA